MREYGWIGDTVLFARYVDARRNSKQREDAYRAYLADGLYAVSNSIARLVNGGQYLAKRFAELSGEQPSKKQESPDEIAARIISCAGITFDCPEVKS